MTSAVLRSAQAGAILMAAGLSAGLMTGVAEAEPPPFAMQSCISPVFPPPSDLNQRYDANQRIIGPPNCRTVYKSEKWVRAVPTWITAKDGGPIVYPPGYTPLKNCGETHDKDCSPREDFIKKFLGARYEIKQGTTVLKNVTVGPEVLQTGFSTPTTYTPAPEHRVCDTTVGDGG